MSKRMNEGIKFRGLLLLVILGDTEILNLQFEWTSIIRDLFLFYTLRRQRQFKNQVDFKKV